MRSASTALCTEACAVTMHEVRAGVVSQHLLEQLEARAAGHGEVGQHQVGGRRASAASASPASAQVTTSARSAEQILRQLPLEAVVVDEQDARATRQLAHRPLRDTGPQAPSAASRRDLSASLPVVFLRRQLAFELREVDRVALGQHRRPGLPAVLACAGPSPRCPTM